MEIYVESAGICVDKTRQALEITNAFEGYYYDCKTNKQIGLPTSRVHVYDNVDIHVNAPEFVWEKIKTTSAVTEVYVLTTTSLAMVEKILHRYPNAQVNQHSSLNYTSCAKPAQLFWSFIEKATLHALYMSYLNVKAARDSRSALLRYKDLIPHLNCKMIELACAMEGSSLLNYDECVRYFMASAEEHFVNEEKVGKAFKALLLDNQLCNDNLFINGERMLIPLPEYIRVSMVSSGIFPKEDIHLRVLSYICANSVEVYKDANGYRFHGKLFSYDKRRLYLNEVPCTEDTILRKVDTLARERGETG